jgi:hypothetical protein
MEAQSEAAGEALQGRLPYEKPALRLIELVADEVLAVGCKTDYGPLGVGNQPGCGISNHCVALGS